MVVRVKVSSKHQIAVPAAVRKALGIECGDSLLMEVRGDHVLVMREPKDYSKALRGLHREVWQDVEPRAYVRREREAWRE